MDDLSSNMFGSSGFEDEDVVNPLLDDDSFDEEGSLPDFDLTSLDVDVNNLDSGNAKYSLDLVDGAPSDDSFLEQEDESFPVVDDGHGGYVELGHGTPANYVDPHGAEEDYSHLPEISENLDSGRVEEVEEPDVSDDSEVLGDSDFDVNDFVQQQFGGNGSGTVGFDEGGDSTSVDSSGGWRHVSHSPSSPESPDGFSSDVSSIISSAFNDSPVGVYDLDLEDEEDPFLNFDVDVILNRAIGMKASDIHLSAGDYPAFTLLGDIVRVRDFGKIPADVIRTAFINITTNVSQSDFATDLELDTSYVVKSGQFKGFQLRLNVSKSFNSHRLVFRVIDNNIPSPASLGIDDVMIDWAYLRNGLIMINGPTGSGKSTTLASVIREIQMNRSCHIVTIERPVEYIFGDVGKALVTQREVGRDTRTFAGALASAMRQAPDVILLGEVRNQVEVNELLRAAETGHLAFSTMHTNSAAATIGRIRSLFDGDEQVRILGTLAEVSRGYVNQALLKTPDGKGRFAVREILQIDDEVSRMILRGDVEAIKNYQFERGITMEHELVKAVVSGKAELREARMNATNVIRFNKLMEEVG